MNLGKHIDFTLLRQYLEFKRDGGVSYIFDPIRRKFLVQTPEETVRQLVIQYLIRERQYPASLLAVEKMVKVNGISKRFDILAFDKSNHPLLLVECKAPQVRISANAFFQSSSYNLALNVPYMLVTNGLEIYCCQIDYDNRSYSFLGEVPLYPVYN
jgi:hypothetical protein